MKRALSPFNLTNSSPADFASTLETLPKAVVARALTLTPAQEVLARRLGGAVILQWDVLSDALQDLLIEQAAIGPNGEDERFTLALIENFIRKAKTIAVQRPQRSEPSQGAPQLPPA